MNIALTISNKNESFIWERLLSSFKEESFISCGSQELPLSLVNLTVIFCGEFLSESAKRCQSYVIVF